MTVSARRSRHSFQDYLAIEEVSTVRHEYFDGEIYAMAGGSVLHAGLSAAILAALHRQLNGRCRVYSSDLRIRVPATGLASYPDVTVVCGAVQPDPDNADTVVNPSIIVEVLSPTTMDYDLGEKFEHYRKIPSLLAVIYVFQDQRLIQIRERSEGPWRASSVGAGGTATVGSLGVVIEVDALYSDAGAAPVA
jgi:Uma2 family endonuclease